MQERSVYDFLNYGLREMPEFIGLDYESAIEATPRLYGVSSGNGNDGVSHMYPSYYVRTCEPYLLAAAACIGDMKAEFQTWAAENVMVDGEADYTISATLLDPPDDNADCDDDDDDDDDNDDEPDEYSSYSMANGAWHIVEVFPVDESEITDSYKMVYDSLSAAMSADLVDLARKAN